MNKQEIIKKLDENKNFHLSLKAIQFVDDNLCNEFKKYLDKNDVSNVLLLDVKNSYEILKKAYDEKIKCVICNEKTNFLLPIVSVINKDDISIIKPMIPVFYYLKDNRIIQRVKTQCHKLLVPFNSFKSNEELFNELLYKLNGIAYKKATMKDLSVILKIKDEVKKRIIEEKLPIWLNGYPMDNLIKEDIENGFGRIVVCNDKIIGYAAFYPSEADYPKGTFKKDNMYSFGRIMVCNEYLRKHIGTFFVKKLIEEAKQLKCNGVGILVDDINEKALRVYKKFNFKKEGSNQFEYAYLDIYGLYF